MSSEQPRVIVGLDFGTSYSGFAFAHITDFERILCYYAYPGTRVEKPYCKTLTASYYKHNANGEWEFKSWGYQARADYERDITALRKRGPGSATTVGAFVTKFKLHLAGREMGPSSAQPLPPGLTVNTLVTDYLRAMGDLILRTFQTSYGSQLSMKEIQWCVTVPSIWDHGAKSTMKTCMAAAGLVNGDHGSPHPLIVVLEPEAASFHCHKVMSEQRLVVGDRLLVVDIGGGTVDIVVQEVVSVENKQSGVKNSSYRVKEVTISSGGLCGGTFVDKEFMAFLHARIGPCLQECINNEPKIYAMLVKRWEEAKVSFGDMKEASFDFPLPSKLVKDWERYDERTNNPRKSSYDEVEISYKEMQSIFDTVIDQILSLVGNQLRQAGTSAGVKVLAVVGGFAASPYLMQRMKEAFRGQVPQIISPPNPGSAVCQGAVALALHPSTIGSRICKKTYGFLAVEPFEQGVDPPEFGEYYDGVLKCTNRFEVYVRKGDHVAHDDYISRPFKPIFDGQTMIELTLYSSDDRDPRYVVGGSAKQEGTFIIDISGDMELEKARRLNVSLFFGRSSIEMLAQGLNFEAGAFGILESTSAFE